MRFYLRERRRLRLLLAMERVKKANRELEQLLHAAFPIGIRIAWQGPRGRRYEGHVVLHGYGDGIKVQNESTGNEIWITAWHIGKEHQPALPPDA